MKQARPERFSSLWMLAAVAVLAAALAGCTLVGDNLTGVGLAADGPTTCVKECNDFYKAEFESEQKLHLENVELCQALEQPDKQVCLDAEGVRHEAAMLALGEAKLECQNNCHRQGEASGS